VTTKYFSFQYSVTYYSQALRHPARRAREIVHLLTHETPDFITPALWLANSPDLNPFDYQIWGSCRNVCSTARFVTSTSWSCTRWSSIKRSGSGVHILELRCAEVFAIRTDAHLTVNHACAYCGHWILMLLSDLTKLAVAVADVDQFCWNLV